MAVVGLAVAFTRPRPDIRIGVVAFLLTSNLANWIHAPRGTVLLLLLAVMIRDASSALGRRPFATTAALLLMISFVLARATGRFGVGVAGGILLFQLVRTSLRTSGLQVFASLAALGGVLGAVLNLRYSDASYYTYVNGQLTLVRRYVATGGDPNAASALLMVGLGGAVYLAVFGKGRMLRTAASSGAAVILVGIVGTGSRTAIALSVVMILGLLSRGELFQNRAAAWLVGFGKVVAAIALVHSVLTETGVAGRFTTLAADYGTRFKIAQNAISRVTESPTAVAFGVSDDHTGVTTAYAPHNSVIELIVAFGLVGVLALASGLWLTGTRRPPLPPAMRTIGLVLCVQALTFGASAQYVPWLGAGLLTASLHHLPGRARRIPAPPPPQELPGRFVATPARLAGPAP